MTARRVFYGHFGDGNVHSAILIDPSDTDEVRRADELGRLLREGGMDVTVVDDAWPAVWRKVVTRVVMSGKSRSPVRGFACVARQRVF